MDQFDFEELIADMFDITDEQREDNSDTLQDKFFEKFGIDFELGFELAKALLPHVPPVKAGLTGNEFHAFVSKSQLVMLMKMEANNQ